MESQGFTGASIAIRFERTKMRKRRKKMRH